MRNSAKVDAGEHERSPWADAHGDQRADQRADAHRAEHGAPGGGAAEVLRSAITGPSVDHAPQSMFPKPAPTTNVHTQVSERKTPHPSRRSAMNVVTARGTCAGRRSPTRNSALTANVSGVDRQRPPGPDGRDQHARDHRADDLAADSAVARTPLACCSCSGGTIAGIRPVDAGLKNPVAAPVRPERTASIQISARRRSAAPRSPPG